MTAPHLRWVMLCASLAVLGSACNAKMSERLKATEGRLTNQVNAVEHRLTDRVGASERGMTEQLTATEARLVKRLTATESRLTERADAHDAQMRETSERVRAHRETLNALADVAGGAKTAAEQAVVAARDAEARLSQRMADRNKYRVLDTRHVHFETGRAEIRREDTKELDEMASALKADPNAILEIHGFADPRGTDRYNNELTRDRADAVIRYLVAYHGIELRQLEAAAMGKTALTAGAKPGLDIFGLARRVDLRLVAPWSSWEDRESQRPDSDYLGAASPPTSLSDDQRVGPSSPPVRPSSSIVGPSSSIVPRELHPSNERWREIVDTISPQELGARD